MASRVARFLTALVVLIGLSTVPAWAADGGIDTYVVDAAVGQQGEFSYQATITPSPSAPDELTIRLATRSDQPDDVTHVFEITDLVVADANGNLAPQVTQSRDAIVLTIDLGQVEPPLTLSYHVAGTTHALAGDTAGFSWPVVQGVSLPIERVEGTVVPGAPALEYGCRSGHPDAMRSCSLYGGGTEQGPNLHFEEQRLAAGDLVIAELSYPGGVMPVTEQIDYRWSLDRAFGVSPANLLAALLTALLGLLLLAHFARRIGRDAPAGEPVVVARFAAVGDGLSRFDVRGAVRPGMVGTLVDERVDPVDITATLLDLAVRGHLRITELPASDAYAPLDWRITRRGDGSDELTGYEAALVEAIDPNAGLLVSELDALQQALPEVQGRLYDEMVGQGWFARRPDEVRSGFGRAGWVGVGLAVVALALLVWFTSFGLLGLVLVGLAAGVLILSARMPARTAQGASVLSGLAILAGQLRVQPVDELDPTPPYHEVSKLLPYAVVLGGSQRWLDALAAADDDSTPDATDLDWFHAPPDWTLGHLPASIDALITSVQGRLFRR